MFTTRQSERISALGEARLIKEIGKWLGPASPPPPRGMGDDCAVLSLDNKTGQILTTDSLSYGQHFDDSIRPDQAGAKLIKRNLSDIAAMGGTPGAALLNLLCGPDIRIDWLQAFIEGIRESCLTYKVQIVGGDISALDKGNFTAVLTQTGHVDKDPILRTGATEDCPIYVTGSLGGSLISKHYAFEPRLAEGQWLLQSGACASMMDLTDGLAKDLKALIPEGCAALLDKAAIPVSEDAIKTANRSGRRAMEHAFCDGEDYELLFTLKPSVDPVRFSTAWKKAFPQTALNHIGQLTKSKSGGHYLDKNSKEPLPWNEGFEHLCSE
jgi:thiamine-monophosphate kinase